MSEPFQAERARLNARFFLFGAIGDPLYESPMVTMQRNVKERRDVLARFVRASPEV